MDFLDAKPVSVLRKSFIREQVEEKVRAVVTAVLLAVLVAVVFAVPTGRGLDPATALAEALAIAVVAFYFGLAKGTRASTEVARGGAQSEEVQRLQAELHRMQDELCAAIGELAQVHGSDENEIEPVERTLGPSPRLALGSHRLSAAWRGRRGSPWLGKPRLGKE